MTNLPNNEEVKKMRHAVHLREQRSEQWKREGERSLWQNLSMVGAIGWLIVTPTLLGMFIGRWLDDLLETGVFYSGALIFLGVSMGSYLAWQKVTRP